MEKLSRMQETEDLKRQLLGASESRKLESKKDLEERKNYQGHLESETNQKL